MRGDRKKRTGLIAHVREALNEDELAIFDLLTKPKPKLTAGQEAQAKRIARELFEKLEGELLIPNWRANMQIVRRNGKASCALAPTTWQLGDVAGDCSHDRPHLLVAGHHQEGRRVLRAGEQVVFEGETAPRTCIPA